jgi:uncharacterized protein with PhoU and TrkA domain
LKDADEIPFIDLSVREILTEMKDTSEVMVDLAYAALMFDSEDIAHEVSELEEKMDNLNYAIKIKELLAARTREDAIQLSGLLQVAAAAEAISNAAGDLVKLQSVDIERRPFLSFMLRESEETIRMTTLSENSDMVNHTIDELAVEAETGMRIIAIRRRQRWIYDPEPETKLKARDTLIVRGTKDGYERLTEFTSGRKPWPFEEV